MGLVADSAMGHSGQQLIVSIPTVVLSSATRRNQRTTVSYQSLEEKKWQGLVGQRKLSRRF